MSSQIYRHEVLYSKLHFQKTPSAFTWRDSIRGRGETHYEDEVKSTPENTKMVTEKLRIVLKYPEVAKLWSVWFIGHVLFNYITALEDWEFCWLYGRGPK